MVQLKFIVKSNTTCNIRAAQPKLSEKDNKKWPLVIFVFYFTLKDVMLRMVWESKTQNWSGINK